MLTKPIFREFFEHKVEELNEQQEVVFFAILRLSNEFNEEFPNNKKLSMVTGYDSNKVAKLKTSIYKKIPELKTWSARYPSSLFDLGEEWWITHRVADYLRMSHEGTHRYAKELGWRKITRGKEGIIYYAKTDIINWLESRNMS